MHLVNDKIQLNKLLLGYAPTQIKCSLPNAVEANRSDDG